MKLAIMQPYLFPYLGYYQLIDAVDKFVFLDDVNYVKKGYINRNCILSGAEKLQFTVPLVKPSQNKLIRDTELHDNYLPWKESFLKTLAHCYSKAPYQSYAIPAISAILDGYKPGDSVADLCRDSIVTISKYLGINTHFVRSSEIYGKDTKGADRIINICKQENTDIYINAIGGRKLYNSKDFATQNIELLFLNHIPHMYATHGVQYLSVIDMLMYCDREKYPEVVKSYEVIQ